MSAITEQPSLRDNDPRVMRTKMATLAAARKLFLISGYTGTTMEDIAREAGVTKRTLYNNYPDKESVFKNIVRDITQFAGKFASGVSERFQAADRVELVEPVLQQLAQQLALGIIRNETIAIRRLLIGEVRTFPDLAEEYFEAAPAQVMKALAAGFAKLSKKGLLRMNDPKLAAAQFAYLIAGEHLDRAIMVGRVPSKRKIEATVQEGVKTFLARYAATS